MTMTMTMTMIIVVVDRAKAWFLSPSNKRAMKAKPSDSSCWRSCSLHLVAWTRLHRTQKRCSACYPSTGSSVWAWRFPADRQVWPSGPCSLEVEWRTTCFDTRKGRTCIPGRDRSSSNSDGTTDYQQYKDEEETCYDKTHGNRNQGKKEISEDLRK